MLSVPEESGDGNTVERPKISARTKKDYWKKFKELCPTLDLHKCKGDIRILENIPRHFGYKRMHHVDENYRLTGMDTGKFSFANLGFCHYAN